MTNLIPNAMSDWRVAYRWHGETEVETVVVFGATNEAEACWEAESSLDAGEIGYEILSVIRVEAAE